jgi:hypothetical protein
MAIGLRPSKGVWPKEGQDLGVVENVILAKIHGGIKHEGVSLIKSQIWVLR